MDHFCDMFLRRTIRKSLHTRTQKAAFCAGDSNFS